MPNDIDRNASAQRRTSKLLTAMGIFVGLGIIAYIILTLLVNRSVPANPDTRYTGTNGISVYYDSSIWSVCQMTEDDTLGTVLEVNPVSGYLRVRCGTESLSPRYYKVGVCEYISGGKRAPRRPDPDDDYSGVRNPAPVVASANADGTSSCPGCGRKDKK